MPLIESQTTEVMPHTTRLTRHGPSSGELASYPWPQMTVALQHPFLWEERLRLLCNLSHRPWPATIWEEQLWLLFNLSHRPWPTTVWEERLRLLFNLSHLPWPATVACLHLRNKPQHLPLILLPLIALHPLLLIVPQHLLLIIPLVFNLCSPLFRQSSLYHDSISFLRGTALGCIPLCKYPLVNCL